MVQTEMQLVVLTLLGSSVGAVRSPATSRTATVRKQHITVCNAYADARPASIQVQPIARQGAGAGGAYASSSAGAIWTRELAYGACEEYHVDLTHRRLSFGAPGDRGACELQPPALGPEAKPAEYLAAAVTQPEAGAAGCAVRTVAVPRRSARRGVTGDDGKDASAVSVLEPAELTLIDAFAEAHPQRMEREEEQAAGEVAKHLRPLPELDAGAVVRLEDKIEVDSIATEVLGSQTLGLGHSYAVEPKELHVVLEDVRGSRGFDWRDVAFEPARRYVAVRTGRAGDTAFPQRLLVHKCEDTGER